MTDTDKNNSNSSIEITDIDDNLTIADIQQDLRECERMIRRSSFKIQLYERKLLAERHPPKNTQSLLEKGLQFFNLGQSKTQEV